MPWQVKEVGEEVQALKKACSQVGGVAEGVQVNTEKLEKLETAMSQIACSATEANAKSLTELTAVKQACDEILAAVKAAADQLVAQVASVKQTNASMLHSANTVAAAAQPKTGTHTGGDKGQNSDCAARVQPTEQGKMPASIRGNQGNQLEKTQHRASQKGTGVPRATPQQATPGIPDRAESREPEPAAPWRRKHRAMTPVEPQSGEGRGSAPSQSPSCRPAQGSGRSSHVELPVNGSRKPASRPATQNRPLQLRFLRWNPDAPVSVSPSLHHGHALATADEAGTEAAGAPKKTACPRVPLADKANAAEQRQSMGASKRRRQGSAEPAGGLSDPFAALFAKVDDSPPCGGAGAAEEADTAAIDDQEIQREVKRRMQMQRMKRMRP